MARARIEHVFRCSEDTYWKKIFFDATYNDELFKGVLGFPSFVIASCVETDDAIRRTLAVTPKTGPLPGPLKKLIGDSVSYREEGVWDKKTRHYRLVITPNRLANKFEVKGDLWAEPTPDGHMKRIFTCEVTANVFGIGGLIEKTVVRDLEANYTTSARFTNQYIETHGLDQTA